MPALAVLHGIAATLLLTPAITAGAQPGEVPALASRVLTVDEAFAQDAAEYARQNDVDPDEAFRRLHAQEESVAATDRIQRTYAKRLAGISIEHFPQWRIVVLLTGSRPVSAGTISAGGLEVPVLFRTGAAATRVQVAEAIVRHRAGIVSAVPGAQGMGLDPRTGELVVLTNAANFDPDRHMGVEETLAALTGVPVRIRALDRTEVDFALAGGSRLEGIDPRDGRRYSCTTGFVVTDLVRTGLVTAAHCPDALTQYDAAGDGTPLEFVGQWGVAFQDVQVHVGGELEEPLFFADADRNVARTLTGARRRTSTRAGDVVCHRGESSGYSCSQVELIDYAPPGDLCAGPCDPVWTTVTGPSCRGGDSGGPVFNGTVAFGIVKGGSYGRPGECGFYYYMSVDYLPDGWSLLYLRP